MPYPAAPWQMHGQLWLSLFRVREGDHPDREPGVYGVALVSYERPSPLTYSELLVARPVNKRVKAFPGSPRKRERSERFRGVVITDIWVDSADSRDGGRELWAIPKGLCDFDLKTEGNRVQHTTWNTTLDGRPIASARFNDVSNASFRTPFKGATWQTRTEPDPRAGEEVVAHLTGSAKSLPARGSWTFAPDGPLGWLAGKRSLASFRMADFQMSFG